MGLSQTDVDGWLAEFASSYRKKRDTGIGEPEAALRAPFEGLFGQVADALGHTLVISDEAHLSDVAARPDWSATVSGVLVGYVELKQVGAGVDTSQYRGRDKEQWEHLKCLPNVLYSDGNSWALYRYGQRVGDIQHLTASLESGAAVSPADLAGWETLIDGFLTWDPPAPKRVEELARTSARLCRLLRREVAYNLEGSDALRGLASDWRKLLFPDATDATFADQYAQTVTFSLLLARAEGVVLNDRPFRDVAYELSKRHGLLGKALELLTDERLLEQLATSLETLQRVIGAVEWEVLTGSTSTSTTGKAAAPWLHFYEDFLAVYDSELRKATGSYYTPDEVVSCTIALVDEALRTHLNKALGVAAKEVTLIDPAVGTGTYLIRTLETVARTIAEDRGEGAVPERLKGFASRMVGFEKQTGPFAVAQMRLAATFARFGATLEDDELRLYVTDTLDDPYIEVSSLGQVYEPIAQSRRKANEFKTDEPVLVCVGNPPYRDDSKGAGGIVEKGSPNAKVKPLGPGVIVEKGSPNAKVKPLLDDFRAPAEWRLGKYEHVLRNLYVFFWRWSLYKAFEAHPDSPHGVVAFITPSSWLRAQGFAGMRRHFRRQCDHIYVIDLGGENKGGRPEENVFAIETPVAIAIAVRDGTRDGELAAIHYRRIRGTAEEKLAALVPPTAQSAISLADDGWSDVVSEDPEPWGAGSTEAWTQHPQLREVFPWAPPGIKPNRTWVYAPEPETLKRRWEILVSTSADDPGRRRTLFKPSRDADPERTYEPLPGFAKPSGTMMAETGSCPTPVQVGFRSFDRQWIIPDRRVIHDPSVNLWKTRIDGQIFVGFNPTPGPGPATTFTAHIPDMPFFQGNANASGRVIPLWRTANEPNIAPGLLELLGSTYGFSVTPEELLAYVAAITSHPGYVTTFWDELETSGARIPITADAGLFHEAVLIGAEIIWAHTYGERYADASLGRPTNHVRAANGPQVLEDVPSDPSSMPDKISHDPESSSIELGSGRIGPVSAEVWEYEVSRMHVIKKWFSYRRRMPGGKKSSPLDDITPDVWTSTKTDELLDLLHVLTRVVALHPQQQELLATVLEGPVITRTDLETGDVLPLPPEADQPPQDATGQLPFDEG